MVQATSSQTGGQTGGQTAHGGSNEVVLRGRLSSEPVLRELPSGASIVTFRLVVPRSETVMTRGSRQKSDWVDCTAWSSLTKRKVTSWHLGDTVQVTGSLRRRHYGGDRAGSAVDVEVLAGRLVQRAGAADVRGSPGAGAASGSE